MRKLKRNASNGTDKLLCRSNMLLFRTRNPRCLFCKHNIFGTFHIQTRNNYRIREERKMKNPVEKQKKNKNDKKKINLNLQIRKLKCQVICPVSFDFFDLRFQTLSILSF